MTKQDLREYSDNELSMMVYNDEYLYNRRRNSRHFKELLDSMFLYTESQLDTLIADLDDEHNDI